MRQAHVKPAPAPGVLRDLRRGPTRPPAPCAISPATRRIWARVAGMPRMAGLTALRVFFVQAKAARPCSESPPSDAALRALCWTGARKGTSLISGRARLPRIRDIQVWARLAEV